MVNLFVFEPNDVVDGHVTITDTDKVAHLHKVLKVVVGSTIKMGQLHGSLYVGHVVEMSVAAVRVRLEVIEGTEFDRTKQSAGVCLLLGTPRPTMIKSICVVSATMGVDHIVMVRSERVDKAYFGSKMMRAEEMKRNLVHGAEQGVVRQVRMIQYRNMYQ
jgi:RsmE family RNA methyltransferase